MIEKKTKYGAVPDEVLKTKKKGKNKEGEEYIHPSSKLIYVYIVTRLHGNRKGYIQIPRSTFSKHLKIHSVSVSKYLKELKDIGWIDIEYTHKAKGSYYTPLKKDMSKGYKSFLEDFLISEDFSHQQKIFLVSISPYILAYKNVSIIEYTYGEMAEKTGLSERFIAEQVRSLSKVTAEGSEYPMIERCVDGYMIDDDVVRYYTQKQLLRMADREDSLEAKLKNYTNK